MRAGDRFDGSSHCVCDGSHHDTQSIRTTQAAAGRAAPRRGAGELEGDVRDALPRLPETFTRREVCEALGYEPDRGSLFRILQGLVWEKSLRIESTGTGQIPTTYRKTGAHDADGAG